MKTIRRSVVTPFVIVALALASAPRSAAQSANENATDAAWLIKALDVQPRSSVGEIGAGAGELTFALARAVGDRGRVFSNELNKDRIEALRNEAAKSGRGNVTIVEGRERETNFPEACCDAIFMRNVYHHFDDPPAMNASLLTSLKPGGRLAVIDFTPPPGGEAAPGGRAADNHHGITGPTLEHELKSAGFEILSSETSNRTVRVVARRSL